MSDKPPSPVPHLRAWFKGVGKVLICRRCGESILPGNGLKQALHVSEHLGYRDKGGEVTGSSTRGT